MADYYGKCRTNYFAVTDEEKFKTFMAACMGAATVEVFEEKQKDGSAKYGFLCEGRIEGLPYKFVDNEPVVTLDRKEADEYLDYGISRDLFYLALQDVLPDDEAVIITEMGWEKMRYLLGYSIVITKNEWKGINLCDKAVELAGDMLHNPAYTTQMDY